MLEVSSLGEDSSGCSRLEDVVILGQVSEDAACVEGAGILGAGRLEVTWEEGETSLDEDLA